MDLRAAEIDRKLDGELPVLHDGEERRGKGSRSSRLAYGGRVALGQLN